MTAVVLINTWDLTEGAFNVMISFTGQTTDIVNKIFVTMNRKSI